MQRARDDMHASSGLHASTCTEYTLHLQYTWERVPTVLYSILSTLLRGARHAFSACRRQNSCTDVTDRNIRTLSGQRPWNFVKNVKVFSLEKWNMGYTFNILRCTNHRHLPMLWWCDKAQHKIRPDTQSQLTASFLFHFFGVEPLLIRALTDDEMSYITSPSFKEKGKTSKRAWKKRQETKMGTGARPQSPEFGCIANNIRGCGNAYT